MKTRIALCAALILIGGAYGYVSAARNQNPGRPYSDNYTGTMANTDVLLDWEPSVVWLPSYFVCRVGIGMDYSKAGYGFWSDADRRVYFLSSTLAGGLLVGWGLLMGYAVHRRWKSIGQKTT